MIPLTRRQALAGAATTALLTATESFAMKPKDLIIINAKVTRSTELTRWRRRWRSAAAGSSRSAAKPGGRCGTLGPQFQRQAALFSSVVGHRQG